ncbi:MAG: class I SAM-dependent methyltransferase family protein, partial [Halobacteria archaeon]|nr:class I SAM-dependent methyltransferase family protein [Halobacteria archaeon]
MTDDEDLALRVPLPKTEEAISRAEKNGIYDDTRSVKRDGNYTLVPVTRRADFDYETVVQDDPVARKKSLDDLVTVENPPSSWKIVGDVVLVKLGGMNEDEMREIGKALLELHSDCRTVL